MLNLICVLLAFQAVSIININLTKSEMVRFGDERDVESPMSVLHCRVVKLPIKYLGLPLGVNHKEVEMWGLITTKYDKKLAAWKKALLSKGGRLTLIKGILGNLPIYYMYL